MTYTRKTPERGLYIFIFCLGVSLLLVTGLLVLIEKLRYPEAEISVVITFVFPLLINLGSSLVIVSIIFYVSAVLFGSDDGRGRFDSREYYDESGLDTRVSLAQRERERLIRRSKGNRRGSF